MNFKAVMLFLSLWLPTRSYAVSHAMSPTLSHLICRGSAPKMLFKYEIVQDVADNYRSRLTMTTGVNQNKDFGWIATTASHYKIPVDSAWPQYKAYIAQEGALFELLIVDANTGEQVDEVPYDHFTCY